MNQVTQQMRIEDLARQDRDRQQELMRDVVRTVSRGNVSLQLGRYITEEDKERMRSHVFSYVIKAPI